MKRRLTRFFPLFGWVFCKAVQVLPGTPAVGDVFTFIVYNTGSFTVSLVAGAGINIVNGLGITSTRPTRLIVCRVTSVAPGAETIDVF